MAVIGGIGHGEAAIILQPGSHLIGTILIGEDLDLYILQGLVVEQTFADGIVEIPGGNAGCIGGNSGQSADDLILHYIACRCSSGMCIAVMDIVGATVHAGVLC